MVNVKFVAGEDLKASWSRMKENADRRKAERNEKKAQARAKQDAPSDAPASNNASGQPNTVVAQQPDAPETIKPEIVVTPPSMGIPSNEPARESKGGGKGEDAARKFEPLNSLVPKNVDIHLQYEDGFFAAGDKANTYTEGTVLRGAGMGETVNVGARVAGQFEPWGALGSKPITGNWSLDLGYEQTPLNRDFYSNYKFKIVTPPPVNLEYDGTLGYKGWNLLGANTIANEQSVTKDNELYLSRTNPDVKDWGYMDGRLSYLMFDGTIRPTVGFKAQGGYENWYVTNNDYHFRGEMEALLGLGIQYNGWNIYGEGSVLGTESEQMNTISSGQSNDAPNLYQSLKDSRYRPLQEYSVSVDTPSIGPVDRLNVSGNYKSYDNKETQWSAGATADIDKWQIGLKYEDNPMLYIGKNTRTTLGVAYTIDPMANAKNARFSIPITLYGKAIAAKINDKDYYGGTIGIELNADLLKTGKSSTGPTYVEKNPK